MATVSPQGLVRTTPPGPVDAVPQDTCETRLGLSCTGKGHAGPQTRSGLLEGCLPVQGHPWRLGLCGGGRGAWAVCTCAFSSTAAPGLALRLPRSLPPTHVIVAPLLVSIRCDCTSDVVCRAVGSDAPPLCSVPHIFNVLVSQMKYLAKY